MKKTPKALMIGTFALALVFAKGLPAQAASDQDLMAMYQEEMTAQYLYTELAATYPETALFSKLAASEARHMQALEKAFAGRGISVEGITIQDISIPPTQEEALAFALDFEKEDIAMLEESLGSLGDQRLERVYTNLLRGSKAHAASLQKVLDVGPENLTCPQDGSGNNQAKANGQVKQQGQGQNPQGHQASRAGQGLQGTCQNDGQGQKSQRNQQKLAQ